MRTSEKGGDMKLNVTGIGVCVGLFRGIIMLWCTLVAVWGFGDVPYKFFASFYFNWFSPTIAGAFFGAFLGLLDGFVGGVILAWIYNKIAK